MTAPEIWRQYIGLTEIEESFKNLKGDLAIRPIFHQKEDRIEAHIFVSFLSYCLHVALRAKLRPLATGLTPRAVLEKFGTLPADDRRAPARRSRQGTGHAPLHRARQRPVIAADPHGPRPAAPTPAKPARTDQPTIIAREPPPVGETFFAKPLKTQAPRSQNTSNRESRARRPSAVSREDCTERRNDSLPKISPSRRLHFGNGKSAVLSFHKLLAKIAMIHQVPLRCSTLA
ncbi:MAG: hypothetical protein ACI9R3_001488 [Verrucomicrobiales bacterium]|jgi:hypothetical protein